MDQFTLTLGPLEQPYKETQAALARLHFTSSLWKRDVQMWTTEAEVQRKIANRLGWLGALDFVVPHLDRVRAAVSAARAEGLTDVVLLGMGGSSLAPEVMRQVIGVAPGFPQFRMLDSVDPDAVDATLADLRHTLFVFASKSGGTIEPNAMAAEAARRLEGAGISPWTSRFIAVTDQNTALHTRAVAEGFREVFVNPSDIGGRYSALSLFGVVPAALMGIDVDTFLARAREMADACRADGAGNPGTALGAFVAAAALNGRDKLTLLLPARLASLGLWIEQLVAESTGKQGVGVVPIAGEAADVELGDDRAVVIVHLGTDAPDGRLVEQAKKKGLPCVEIHVPDVLSLGAEFFRWEVATATAGRLLSVNPFDEPNVQQAKDATKVLLDAFAANGALPEVRSDAVVNGATLTFSNAARQSGDPQRFLDLAGAGDYVSVMAFLPPEDETLGPALDALRHAVGRRTGCATMFGYGPRYLHSTGQLHKGGANNGVFIVVTAPPRIDFAVPGSGYSFGTLERAQAIGDFNSLEHTGRRAVLVQLPSRTPDAIASLTKSLVG
ncbi:MAG: glucose-6-phosphate isomerase [Vicinamibacterales bacterium]